ncbi:MAG: hypothetical protein QGH47_04525 [Candidatus Woesearchaeota archaeon]|nr:hypothetical protein [Candidatus Woesearchaeota archaeon]
MGTIEVGDTAKLVKSDNSEYDVTIESKPELHSEDFANIWGITVDGSSIPASERQYQNGDYKDFKLYISCTSNEIYCIEGYDWGQKIVYGNLDGVIDTYAEKCSDLNTQKSYECIDEGLVREEITQCNCNNNKCFGFEDCVSDNRCQSICLSFGIVDPDCCVNDGSYSKEMCYKCKERNQPDPDCIEGEVYSIGCTNDQDCKDFLPSYAGPDYYCDINNQQCVFFKCQSDIHCLDGQTCNPIFGKCFYGDYKNCIDTDNGINSKIISSIYIDSEDNPNPLILKDKCVEPENLEGIISYKNVDSCNNFGCSVKEWYCGDDSSAQVEVIRCEDGCFEGACL